MSADTTPISPARFAAALKGLSIPMLHLKVLEVRNAIAHLQYSNDQLRPFADGTATAITDATSNNNNDTAATAAGEPDQDCIDAIRENEQVMERMVERIALVRIEVEDRGASWTEFEDKEMTEAGARTADLELAAAAEGTRAAGGGGEEAMDLAALRNGGGNTNGSSSNPWTDGTFQTGTIVNGEVHMDAQPGGGAVNGVVASTTTTSGGGGSLSDAQLRVAMEERMRQLTTEDEEEDGGLHL